MKPQRVGVVPWLLRDGELHVVVVRSRDGQRWVLPKGRIDKQRTRRDMAEREAWAFEFVILGLGALCWTCLLVYFVWNRYLDERRMHWANLGIGAEEEGPAAKGTKAKRG